MSEPTQKEFDPERIKTLTQTAKGVWFGYLGALAFTGITLLGVKDVDFFKLDSSTELPLIGVSVPVTSFFWAGALLLAIIYCYLHVFLEQLWVELAAVKSESDDQVPMAEQIHPWLISEFALIIRLWTRNEDPPPIRMSPLGYFGVGASAILGWLAGPIVLFFFWLWSQPAHDKWMTWACAIAFGAAAWAMVESLRSLFGKMESNEEGFNLSRSGTSDAPIPRFLVLAAVIILFLVSPMRTGWNVLPDKVLDDLFWDDFSSQPHAFWRVLDFQPMLRPVAVNLVEANLVELPADWQTRDTAMKAFYAVWCKRPDTPTCDDNIDIKSHDAFQSEWMEKRATYLRLLAKPNLQGRDLSFADLSHAHLPGLDLSDANLNRADLREAQMEGADLREAQMEGANLR